MDNLHGQDWQEAAVSAVCTDAARQIAMIRERVGLGALLRRAQRRCARLFPAQACLLCGAAPADRQLCAFCRRRLPPCAWRTDWDAPARACGLDALRIAHDYRFPLDVLLAEFKYQRRLALAGMLARLWPAPPACPAWLPGLRLLAVPPGGPGLQRRGFAPLQRIARHYVRLHALAPVLDTARRRREVAPQAGLGRRERGENPQALFALESTRSPLLLLDDVLTTGATLTALARAARSAGAPWVGAVVLARTPAEEEWLAEC